MIDTHGNEMTGGAEAVSAYDHAIDRYLRFHPDVVASVDALNSQHPDAPMGWALAAYLNLSSTDADDLPAARSAAQALSALSGNERESGHAAAIDAWTNGDWDVAARRLDDVLEHHPTDVLALLIGHQLDFFTGNAVSLRDRPLRTLRDFPTEHAHLGFVQGMAAFGLEEAGQYHQSIDAGQAAVTAHPDDVWAIHAVVHCFEMLGRVDDGIRFLASDTTRWETDNLFTVHNWWHLALYQLEAGNPERALAIYDTEINGESAAGVPIEMLDASALLWRLWLDGTDPGDRFEKLATSWEAKSGGEPWYAFNDLHAVMALAGAGRLPEAHAVTQRLEHWLGTAGGSNAMMTSEVGLPACRAVVAWAEERYDDVVETLLPIRRITHHFGGSHAQRDALHRLLLESAIRSRRFDLARALSSERLEVREASPYSWSQRARSLRGLGDEAGAAAADREATTHRDRFRLAG